MNLHSIAAPYVGAVNPLTLVSIRISAGVGPSTASGLRPPLYETPGAMTASIAAGLMTVNGVSAGVLRPGQTLTAAGLLPNTTIARQISGLRGKVGTYQVSQVQDLANSNFTTSLLMLAQIQPLTMFDLHQLEGLNLNGDKKAIYLNGAIDGVVRVRLKGGDLIDTPEGQTWLVSQNLEGFNETAGWTKAAMVLQSSRTPVPGTGTASTDFSDPANSQFIPGLA